MDKENNAGKEIKEAKETTHISENSHKLFDVIQKGKNLFYFKNKDNNFNVTLNSKSFCKIFEQSKLIEKIKRYIIFNETTVIINYSNEIYDDNNGKIFQFIKNKNEFFVTMATDTNTNFKIDKNNKNKIILKNKSINRF